MSGKRREKEGAEKEAIDRKGSESTMVRWRNICAIKMYNYEPLNTYNWIIYFVDILIFYAQRRHNECLK